MDAYLICEETRKAIWLGKPIRTRPKGGVERVEYYHQGAEESELNHECALLNRVLWKFLAEHAHKTLRIVFSGDYPENEFEQISTHDCEAEEYLRDWPCRNPSYD